MSYKSGSGFVISTAIKPNLSDASTHYAPQQGEFYSGIESQDTSTGDDGNDFHLNGANAKCKWAKGDMEGIVIPVRSKIVAASINYYKYTNTDDFGAYLWKKTLTGDGVNTYDLAGYCECHSTSATQTWVSLQSFVMTANNVLAAGDRFVMTLKGNADTCGSVTGIIGVHFETL